MIRLLLILKNNLLLFYSVKKRYRKLQRHLNKQALGFPSTLFGVELKILKEIFSTIEADVALYLSYKFDDFETIYNRLNDRGYNREELKIILNNMGKKGCIFIKNKNNKNYYALHSLSIGMFEIQNKNITASFYLSTREYVIKKYTMEYLFSDPVQMRVIPIQKSIKFEHKISPYSEIRAIIEENEGKIYITECVCKLGMGRIGIPCKKTNRREICMGFRDFHDFYIKNKLARSISKKEAMEILNQNEKDGLVLICSNCKEVQFVCSCCSCCCGVLQMVSCVARPSDFVASNFFAKVNAETCIGCGKCRSRCPMNAIKFKKEKILLINENRCIGCGLCVSECKSESIKLVKKKEIYTPPQDFEKLYDIIMKNKKSRIKKMLAFGKALLGKKI